tara:strand:+ start:915 stop:2543 length:1629 start_codon:yes stop_codon:yes gene_type:complete
MKVKKLNQFILYSFFISYLIVGIFTLEDYGVNIEEHTQIFSGFYWLNYIFEFFQIGQFHNEIKIKLDFISNDKNLPDPEIYTYGPVFDLPIAFFEVWLDIKDVYLRYAIRHFSIFIIFYLSAIIFFNTLYLRFKNFFVCSAGTLLYIFSPRIYGDSFHNSKDILFLSLVVFTIFFAFKLFKKIKIKNIILFSVFAALSTSTRILGLFLPISFILFIFFKLINKKKNYLQTLILISFFYIIFLIIHWPYLWESPISNFLEFYSKSKSWIFSYYILYEGEYYLTDALPDSFIFKWISITTPIFNLILFFSGIIFLFIRFFKRFISIENISKHKYDLWRSDKEMMDYFIIFNITSILLILLFLDVPFVSGWRHLYFLNVFIVYVCSFFLYFYNLKFKDYKKILRILFIFFFSFNIYKIILFHPYQSLYFNEFLKEKNSYLVDRDGLSRFDSINKILSLEKKKNKINLANASFVPYYRIKDSFRDEKMKKINFVGTEFNQADYIYNNFVYEVNPEYNDKYKIPQNFKQIYVLEIDGIKIYEIYRKN